jgi:DNA (cytosine-5)-methyltransferase 1
MRAMELFAGAGGLGIGVSQAGFETAQVIEWDRYCCDTIRQNKTCGLPLVATWPLYEGDIRDFDFEPFDGKLDLLSGGPPCQPFSVGGKHQASKDTRDMFPEAVRAVRQSRPRAFVFENVKGLTRATFSNYYEYIYLQLCHPEIERGESEDWPAHHSRLERHHVGKRRISGLEYRVVRRVLNAANYGIPQKRERVFFVGFRADLGLEWNFPEETHSLDRLIWEQCRSGDYWERHCVPSRRRRAPEAWKIRSQHLSQEPVANAWRTVRDAIGDLPEPDDQPMLARMYANHQFQPGARSYKGHTGSPIDEPAKTLKAGVHGVPGGENMVLLPNGRVRYFSVRESARLQTFPDDFIFHGSWSEAMRQLGNAVPVYLARKVAISVRDQLHGAAAARVGSRRDMKKAH